jgi:hypothetical protein
VIDLPTSECVAYLARFRISACFVIGPDAGGSPCCIGGAVDLRRALSIVAKRTPAVWRNAGAPGIVFAAWADRAAIARLTNVVQHELRGHLRTAGLIDAKASVVQSVIMNVARRLETPLARHSEVMARVRSATARIADKVEASRSNGAMSTFNETYRARRLAAQREGRRMIPYGLAVRRLRLALGEHSAAAHGVDGALPIDIERRVFGEQ